jgi:hydroxymethylbilane synthase
MKLRLATRGSALAWTQSGLVADSLRALGHEVELVRLTTKGDVSDAPLASLGGTGVFVGAVRAAVLSGDCDLAVHSFKDLPTAPAAGLQLAAVPKRENPADALCARAGLSLAELPAGASVGTGSPRRAAQLLALRPDLSIVEIRGNVETRLARAGQDLDAVVLAAAGLHRLGLSGHITELFDVATFLPAPAQGALAVECRTDAPDVLAALSALDDPATRLAAIAERAVLAGLEAGCAAPVAAHATLVGDRLVLAASVVSLDGSRQLDGQATAEPSEAGALELGRAVAGQLLAAGAGALVDLGAAKPKPLAGRRILLPERSPAGTAEALVAAGATVVPSSFTAPQRLPLTELEAALAGSWHWIVFTSATTLTILADAGFDLAGQLPAGVLVASVGPATASALERAGIAVDLVAEPGGGAALAAAFPTGSGRVLLPGAEDPSEEPAAGLTAKGWRVRPVAVYRTVACPQPPEVLAEWRTFDAFVVTAGSVARAAVTAAGIPGPKVVAIGTAAAAAARATGLDVVAVADRPDAIGLVGALLAALA